MGITLASNIASLRAQRMLSANTASLGDAYERLASGQRINRASDDAAGLAVAESLRTEARVLTQAYRNVNDGISLLNIVDGALQAQGDILIRLKELAQQAANGSFSAEQRQSMAEEYNQLVTEIGRIAETTEFNGQTPLSEEEKGAGSRFALQVGSDGASTSLLTLSFASAAPLSGTAAFRGSIASNEYFNILDIEYWRDNTTSLDQFYENVGGGLMRQVLPGSDGLQHDLYVTFSIAKTNAFDTRENLHLLVFETDEAGNQLAWGYDDTLLDGDTLGGDLAQNISSNVTLTSGTTVTVRADLRHLDLVKIGSAAADNSTSAIEFSGVESRLRSLDALEIVSNRLNEVASMRGELGALQSRLDIAGQNVLAGRENTSAAASRILDSDIASEAARLTSAQILQQSAAAVLAQANVQPALALALLRQ